MHPAVSARWEGMAYNGSCAARATAILPFWRRCTGAHRGDAHGTADAGVYTTQCNESYPHLQLPTVRDLLDGTSVAYPGWSRRGEGRAWEGWGRRA